MSKNLIRVFSLLLCFVMLLCVVPDVGAEPLDRVRMPQMRELNFDESGEIYFTEETELEGLIAQVKSHPNVFFNCTYQGTEPLVLVDGLTIPQNLSVKCYSGIVRIPENVNVTVHGFLGASELEVLGNLSISATGGAAAAKSLQVMGNIQVDGFLNLLSGMDTEIVGTEKISCGVTGAVWVICTFDSEAELRQQVAAANSAPKNWKYDCYNGVSSLNLTSPLVIPENFYLSADESEQGSDFTLSGSPITVNGEMDIYTSSVIKNDLMVEENGYLYVQMEDQNDTLTLEGKVVSDGSIDVLKKTVVKGDLFLGSDSWLHVVAPLTMEKKVTNLGIIDFYYGNGGVMTFSRPDQYEDGSGEEAGVIYINGSDNQIPGGVFVGLKLADFTVKHYSADVADVPCWRLTDYNYQKPQEPQKPSQGTIAVTAMYRLYNPNSGEHFYTGSTQERDMLKAAGWHYEGIAWNAPTKSGAPVYRLYNPNSGDHHYTMSADERNMLVSVGWKYEGVAWNSASSSHVPLYRLYNPNADCGSHHYTGSKEERNNLVNVGWIYEGIGWYGIA